MKVNVVVGLILGVLFGVIASQYFPMFGGFEKLGQPWSQARMSLIGIHVIVLGIVGAGAGAGLAMLGSKK